MQVGRSAQGIRFIVCGEVWPLTLPMIKELEAGTTWDRHQEWSEREK